MHPLSSNLFSLSNIHNNVIILLNVNDVQVEEVSNVRATIYDHFTTHFKSVTLDKPELDDFTFKRQLQKTIR